MNGGKTVYGIGVMVTLGIILVVGRQLLGASNEDRDIVTCSVITGAGDDLAYYVGKGNVFFDRGDYDSAVAAYTCAVNLNPAYVQAYINRGYTYMVQGNDTLALDDYNRALGIDLLAVGAYINRGILYAMRGYYETALTDFDLSVALAPDYAVAYNNRGIIYALTGNYDLAIADFERAIGLAPNFAEPYAALGMAYSTKAVASYATYQNIVGDGDYLPIATSTVIQALAVDTDNEAQSVWLAVFAPAR